MNRFIAAISAAGLVGMALVGYSLAQSGGAASGQQPESRVPVPVPDKVIDQARNPVLGAASCAGVGCHGRGLNELPPQTAWATQEDNRWKSSYLIWRAYDPHAQAYAVLLNPQSVQIAERLWGPNAKAQDQARCLACHANPTLAESKAPYADALRSEGVGCESCHGNAGSWIDDHSSWLSGPDHSAQLTTHGMRNLSDIPVRSEVCAGCHVGAPAGEGLPEREMNHDLIAAGHPRLNFDYATFLRAMPSHWIEKNRDVSPSTLRPRSEEFTHWVVGRTTTTAAHLRLLSDRVKRNAWPEFADFDCYACHHNLSPKVQARVGSLPGAMTWNEPNLLLPLATSTGKPALSEEMRDLRQSLLSPGRTAGIVKNADRAASSWSRLAESWALHPPSTSDVATSLANLEPRRWDEACQLYYSLLAIDRSRDRAPTEEERKQLIQLQRILSLPRESNGAKFNSPINFHPTQMPFRELFQLRIKK